MKKILCLFTLFFLFSLLEIEALRIGNVEITHDLVQGWRYYSGWYGEIRPAGSHWGVDIPGNLGATIHPAMPGKVVGIGEDNYNGKYIIIQHEVENIIYESVYLHLSSINVLLNQIVDTTDKIGGVGSTGDSDGYHLHYALYTWITSSSDPFVPPKKIRIAPYPWTPEALEHGLKDEKYKEWGEKDSKGDDSWDGGDGGADGGASTPGNDCPDDNESFSTSTPVSISSEPISRFYRLAVKKENSFLLHYWNFEKLLKERDKYFESLAQGGTPDETYLNNLNSKINELYNLLTTNGPQFSKERSETPDVVIVRNGYFRSSSSLTNKFSEAWRRVPSSFSPLEVKGNPVMVISSGGLFGMESSEQLKSTLADYVAQGGTLICFCQQHGYEYAALPRPDGKTVGAYGWREDQSCWTGSTYINTWHPALSSVTTSDVSVPVDGYIFDYPEDATVLLRKC